MDVEVASDGGVHDPAGEDVGEAAVITSTSDGVKHSYRRGGRGQPALWGAPRPRRAPGSPPPVVAVGAVGQAQARRQHVPHGVREAVLTRDGFLVR